MTTVLQRRRARRDLIIRMAHDNGVSQRVIADVFGLPPSRVCAIVNAERPPLALKTDPAFSHLLKDCKESEFASRA